MYNVETTRDKRVVDVSVGVGVDCLERESAGGAAVEATDEDEFGVSSGVHGGNEVRGKSSVGSGDGESEVDGLRAESVLELSENDRAVSERDLQVASRHLNLTFAKEKASLVRLGVEM